MNPNTEKPMLNLHGVKFPQSLLQLHLLVSGATGSGKTHGILKPIVRQILASETNHVSRRPAMIVFDVKGDLLPMIQTALAKCGREDDLVKVGIGEDEVAFNPLADTTLTPTQIAQQLAQASEMVGQEASQRAKTEELFWATARKDLLTSLIELTRMTLRQAGPEPLTFAHLQRARGLLSHSSTDLNKWIAAAAPTLSETSALALKEWANLPDTTRACITSSVGSVLAPWTREPLCKLVIPDGKRRTLDVHRIVDSGKVVVINVAHAENAEELWPACLLLKQAIFRLALSRSRLPINQERLVVVVLDEANRLLSAHNSFSSEHVAMEMARSNRVAFILAAQSLSGLSAVNGEVITDKLAALCGNQVFLANNCPATLRLAQRCFGTKLVKRRHETRTSVLAPPQIFPEDVRDATEVDQVTLVPTEVPVISAKTLARLPVGAACVKLADGSSHRIKCAFD